MNPRVAGALVILVFATASVTSASPAPVRAARTAHLSSVPPQLLNIVRVKVKPGAGAQYAAIEAQVVRACERAGVGLFWLALTSPRDQGEVLYLNLYESREAADRAAAAYQDAVRAHPDLGALTDRLRGLTLSDSSVIATRRDDAEAGAPGVDFSTMRQLRLTMVQVRPGQEGDFLDAVRTAPPRGDSWLVYEANDSPAFALVTLKRTAFDRSDVSPLPRPLRRARRSYGKQETRVYTLRPAMSHVPPSFFR